MKFIKMFVHVFLICFVLLCIGYDTTTWEYWVVTFLSCSAYISGYETGKRSSKKKKNERGTVGEFTRGIVSFFYVRR